SGTLCCTEKSVLFGNCFFRREGRDDFFETRVASERIPYWIQFQVAVMHAKRRLRRDGQLFKGQILLARPSINSCELRDKAQPVNRIFGHWHEFASATPFAHSFLVATEASVDLAEKTPGNCVIGLIAEDVFRNPASSGEGGVRRSRIVKLTSSNAHKEFARVLDAVVL